MKPNNKKNGDSRNSTYRIPRVNRGTRPSGYILPAEEQIRHLLLTLISTFQGLLATLFPATSIVGPSMFGQSNRRGGHNPSNRGPRTGTVSSSSGESAEFPNSSNCNNSPNQHQQQPAQQPISQPSNQPLVIAQQPNIQQQPRNPIVAR